MDKLILEDYNNLFIYYLTFGPLLLIICSILIIYAIRKANCSVKLIRLCLSNISIESLSDMQVQF